MLLRRAPPRRREGTVYQYTRSSVRRPAPPRRKPGRVRTGLADLRGLDRGRSRARPCPQARTGLDRRATRSHQAPSRFDEHPGNRRQKHRTAPSRRHDSLDRLACSLSTSLGVRGHDRWQRPIACRSTCDRFTAGEDLMTPERACTESVKTAVVRWRMTACRSSSSLWSPHHDRRRFTADVDSGCPMDRSTQRFPRGRPLAGVDLRSPFGRP